MKVEDDVEEGSGRDGIENNSEDESGRDCIENSIY